MMIDDWPTPPAPASRLTDILVAIAGIIAGLIWGGAALTWVIFKMLGSSL